MLLTLQVRAPRNDILAADGDGDNSDEDDDRLSDDMPDDCGQEQSMFDMVRFKLTLLVFNDDLSLSL